MTSQETGTARTLAADLCSWIDRQFPDVVPDIPCDPTEALDTAVEAVGRGHGSR